jgi:hypothetical protein
MQNKIEGPIEQRETPPLKWKALFVGMKKVKWDIVVDTTNEQLGMGFIVWDHEGFVLVA